MSIFEPATTPEPEAVPAYPETVVSPTPVPTYPDVVTVEPVPVTPVPAGPELPAEPAFPETPVSTSGFVSTSSESPSSVSPEPVFPEPVVAEPVVAAEPVSPAPVVTAPALVVLPDPDPPFTIELILTVQVTPGTLKTVDEITADLLNQVDRAAIMAGFAYGPREYSVSGVAITPEKPGLLRAFPPRT